MTSGRGSGRRLLRAVGGSLWVLPLACLALGVRVGTPTAAGPGEVLSPRSGNVAGASEPQVSRRLSAGLTDLVTVAPPDRRGPLERQLRLLTAAVHRAHDDEEDARAALVPEAEGIGAGAGVTDRPLLPAVVGAVATSGA